MNVPPPASGLGSNSNYLLASNCNPLLGVTVTINVTQDIVCKSASGSTTGFGFQLNAYSPKNETSAWQQYVIALFSDQVIGAVDNWPLTGNNIINDFFNLVELSSAKIPAGYVLKISLINDSNGNITGATYQVQDDTAGNIGAWLVLQNDGNLVIYSASSKPLWASNTVVPAQPGAPTAQDRLVANQGLMPGQSMTSGDGRFKVIFQTDGNLVLYGPGQQALWASGTNGKVVWDAIMQGDGNLVIYDPHGHPLWASNTNGNVGAWLSVQNDGNLVIYSAGSKALWATNTVVPGQPVTPANPDRMAANQGLMPGQSITSQDGRFRLIFQTDGNLVLYGPGNQPYWASGTNGKVVWDAVMQGDGNLVIYDPQGHPLWASNTNGNAGAYVVMQNDGNLVIYSAANKPLWASNTVVPAEPAPPDPEPPGRSRLMANQGLMPGQSITSADSRFRLVLQMDGNLVLYAAGNQALWASGTNGKVVWDVVMQGDGNLVIYDPHGHPLWASNTNGNPGAWVTVQTDGNLVIYSTANKPLWASNTVVPGQPSGPTAPDRMTANQGLIAGESITSGDGRFKLMLQLDGNLVLYGPGNQALWATGTNGKTVWDAIMQGDGNLVIYDPQGHPLWASNTAGNPGAYVVAQDDGNLVIYSAVSKALWASNTVVPTQPVLPTTHNQMTAGQGLMPGQTLLSPDGRFTLLFQTDGNLVLYGPGNQPYWASGTNGKVVWDAVMQGDGNFVIYNPHAAPLWASNTEPKTLADTTVNLLSISGVTSSEVAPIIAFELNLVGPVNSESAVLSSGAGTIVYTATNAMTVLNAEPACAESGYVTAETANSVYGQLSSTPGTSFTQTFGLSPAAAPMIKKLGKIRPSLRIPMGTKAIARKASDKI